MSISFPETLREHMILATDSSRADQAERLLIEQGVHPGDIGREIMPHLTMVAGTLAAKFAGDSVAARSVYIDAKPSFETRIIEMAALERGAEEIGVRTMQLASGEFS